MESLMMPGREKYWEELTDIARIERLAEKFEYLHRIINDQSRIIERLKNHVHVNDVIFFREGGVNVWDWPNSNILNRNRS